MHKNFKRNSGGSGDEREVQTRAFECGATKVSDVSFTP